MDSYGRARQQLTAVAADTYRPCRQCPGDYEADFHTVTVYRVTVPAVPWWLTLEIHCCPGGHSELIVRMTKALLRPDLWTPRRLLAPSRSGQRVRAFEVINVDSGHQGMLTGAEIDSDLDCESCKRPYGVTIYELSDDTIPSWISLEIHYCDGCGNGHIDTGAISPRPVEPVPDTQSSAKAQL
ncbi:hypothetical protein [Nocardia sp. NPDC052112]|uniref:hypothetical protein n=1 Tax=Nocardia sp. NPDC052112 TaxID=3155646 RepID=UPI00344300D3